MAQGEGGASFTDWWAGGGVGGRGVLTALPRKNPLPLQVYKTFPRPLPRGLSDSPVRDAGASAEER